MKIVQYLFSPFPGSAFTYHTTLIIYAGILLAAAVIIKFLIVTRKQNKALRKTLQNSPNQFVWSAIIIVILSFSRIKGVPYLSMRFLLFIAIAASFYYIGKTIYNIVKKYPEMKKITVPKKIKEEKKSYTTHKSN